MLLNERFSVAPMMEWTDPHCRYFLRLISKYTALYTEMISADSVIFGPRQKLLNFNAEELPCILQLGGSNPQRLAQAAKFAKQTTDLINDKWDGGWGKENYTTHNPQGS